MGPRTQYRAQSPYAPAQLSQHALITTLSPPLGGACGSAARADAGVRAVNSHPLPSTTAGLPSLGDSPTRSPDGT
ncbi:Uncharacterised protein [Streptomyces griseus]|nr:Uncharacterised protein [Streptomyces griseus]